MTGCFTIAKRTKWTSSSVTKPGRSGWKSNRCVRAGWLGGLFAVYATGWHPLLILMALYAITTVMTELVSNNASVVILVPVAISVAGLLNLAVFPLVLIVMFAASTSFLSPVGYQTNTMIYGTGLYKFTDFIKVGGPLNLLLMVVTSTAIYLLWPITL